MPLKLDPLMADEVGMPERKSDKIMAWFIMAVVWFPASPFLFAWLLWKWLRRNSA